MSRRKKPPRESNIKSNGYVDLANRPWVPGQSSHPHGTAPVSTYGSIAAHVNHELITLDRITLTYVYSSDGIAQTLVDLPIQDALAKGVEITSPQMDADDTAELLDHMQKTDQWNKLRQAWTWARLYGGGGLLINTNQDPNEKIDYRSLYNQPLDFYAVDRWQIPSVHGALEQGDAYYPLDDNKFLFHGETIDGSRLLLIKGKEAPIYTRRILRGWGMSVLERVIQPLNLYNKTRSLIYELLDEAKIDVYHINSLSEKVSSQAGTIAVDQQLQVANALKNYHNALVLDKEDDFEQKTLTFAGLSEVLREIMLGVSAAMRFPVTKAFGLSASGFNTGESDLESYN